MRVPLRSWRCTAVLNCLKILRIWMLSCAIQCWPGEDWAARCWEFWSKIVLWTPRRIYLLIDMLPQGLGGRGTEISINQDCYLLGGPRDEWRKIHNAWSGRFRGSIFQYFVIPQLIIFFVSNTAVALHYKKVYELAMMCTVHDKINCFTLLFG